MIIIPSSRKMTFQSIPEDSLKNIAASSVAPMMTMSAAPPSATSTRGSFSVAMNTYAAMNTTTASTTCTLTRDSP